MKFARNARILRGQLDAAPFAIVFFLLVIFVMLGTIVYRPGINIHLPVADNLPGIAKPTVTVAMDASKRLFYANRPISEDDLKIQLRNAVRDAKESLTLVIQADATVPYESIISLALLARDAGVSDALLATSPRLITPNPKP